MLTHWEPSWNGLTLETENLRKGEVEGISCFAETVEITLWITSPVKVLQYDEIHECHKLKYAYAAPSVPSL